MLKQIIRDPLFKKTKASFDTDRCEDLFMNCSRMVAAQAFRPIGTSTVG